MFEEQLKKKDEMIQEKDEMIQEKDEEAIALKEMIQDLQQQLGQVG